MAEGYSEQDRAAEDAARDRQNSRHEHQSRHQKRLAGAMIELLPKRDLEVLEWVCKMTGKKPGQVIFEMVRVSIIKERRAHREAKGGGGASSQNLEVLSERLASKG